jgi:hypothetical protein
MNETNAECRNLKLLMMQFRAPVEIRNREISNNDPAAGNNVAGLANSRSELRP